MSGARYKAKRQPMHKGRHGQRAPCAAATLSKISQRLAYEEAKYAEAMAPAVRREISKAEARAEFRRRFPAAAPPAPIAVMARIYCVERALRRWLQRCLGAGIFGGDDLAHYFAEASPRFTCQADADKFLEWMEHDGWIVAANFYMTPELRFFRLCQGDETPTYWLWAPGSSLEGRAFAEAGDAA